MSEDSPSTRWDALPRMYTDEGMSIRQIAAAAGLPYTSVHRYLTQRLGELRPRGGPRGAPRGLPRDAAFLVDGKHGELSTYRRGCGCVPCREANTTSLREYRQRRAASALRSDDGDGQP